MDQFESLYVVWTLEPDYAIQEFYRIYGNWEGFLYKAKPTKEQKIKAKEIIDEQDTNRKAVVQGNLGESNGDMRSLQTTLSFD